MGKILFVRVICVTRFKMRRLFFVFFLRSSCRRAENGVSSLEIPSASGFCAGMGAPVKFADL